MDYLFFDTSSMAKYYRSEIGSAEVIKLVNDDDHTCYISRLTLVESHSIFARLVREEEISSRFFEQWRARFLADLRARVFQVVRFSPIGERDAIRLLSQIGPIAPLRALDAIQLAVANRLKHQGELDQFICADRNLSRIAASQNISVLNPQSDGNTNT